MLGETIALGPGKADLMAAIGRTGSISAAARALGMSYRRAWDLVDEMNRCFATPLVATATGGSGGGGAYLTALGGEMLACYRRLERELSKAGEETGALIKAQLRAEPLPVKAEGGAE